MKRVVLPLLLVWSVLVGLSCQSSPAGDDSFKRSARMDAASASTPEERLRDELGEFMVYFDRTLTRLKNNAIALAEGDPGELETLRVAVGLIERKFTEAYAQPDAVEALIELWYDAYRLNAWRWETATREMLLFRTPGLSMILNRIREIARRWSQPPVFEELDRRIREQAQRDEEEQDFINPVSRQISRTPALVTENPGDGLVSVLGLPFAPFKAAGSLSQTAAEIGVEAQRIADRVDRLPSDLGHQAELIVLGVLASPQVRALIDDLNRLTGDFGRLSEETTKIEGMIDGLPIRVREEATTFLETLETRSDNIAAANRAVRETLTSGSETLERLAEASDSLGVLALQVEQTTLRLDALFEFSRAPAGGAEPGPDYLQEIRLTADSISETARELRTLLATPDLETIIDRLDESVDRVALQADTTAGLIVDRVAWRLALLLVLAFVLGGGLLWFVSRHRQSRPSRTI